MRLLFSLLFAVSLFGQEARVDALFAKYNASPSPGLAVAVVRDGKVILRRGYGLANIERKIPITPSTVFDAASLAKQFTGYAIATLVTQGKLALTDDVRKYIPELHDFGHPITIDQLVQHTSGLRDWPGLLRMAGSKWEEPITQQQILELAYRQRTLNFAPGAEHLYSNTGYSLLAEVVHRVTGLPFSQWAFQNIFQPLGMKSTYFRDSLSNPISTLSYRDCRPTSDQLAAPGSSSLFTTVDDFALWLASFDRANDALKLMRTNGKLNDGSVVPYAFGITNGSWRGMEMFTSSGGWASFNTYDVYLPKQKLGIVVFANADENEINAQNAVIDIAKIYLEEPFAAADYTGRYVSEELGASYEVTVKNGGLQLGANPLTHENGDAFSAPRNAYVATVKFQRDANGRVIAFVVNGDERNRDVRFTRDWSSSRR